MKFIKVSVSNLFIYLSGLLAQIKIHSYISETAKNRRLVTMSAIFY